MRHKKEVVDGSEGGTACTVVATYATSRDVAKPSNISRRRSTALAEGGVEYAAKRTEIVGIAARIFKERGFKAARLAEIAEVAGLDRATLYYYVGSKEELFRESVGSVFDANVKFMDDLLAQAELSPIEKLAMFTEQLMVSYSDNFPFPYVYIQEQMHQVSDDDTHWAQEILRKTHYLEDMVMGLLREGVAAGSLRADLPVRLAANALFGMLNWTHRWYEPGQRLDARSVAQGFSDIFLDGMRPRTWRS